MTTQSAPSPQAQSRIESIDWLRGMVMILMLLDHARDFIHGGAFTGNPLDPATTTPALYLTRWVTHLCAPTFVFLAGMSARLQLLRGLCTRALSRYLVTRGLFLVAVELLVLGPMMPLEPGFEPLAFLQVIWVLGWSMVILGGLVHAPLWFVASFGALQVLLHNSLDWIEYGWPARTLDGALWALLHQPNGIELGHSDRFAVVMYPLMPWVGVMALGFVAGRLFALEPARRRRLLVAMGSAAVLAFLTLRWINSYGDPIPWSALGSTDSPQPWNATLSFFNVEKYPPSLLYLLITLGIALLVLAALEGRRFGRIQNVVLTLGRVPLFFYILQWPLLMAIGWGLRALNGPASSEGAGLGLPAVYLGWAAALIASYPLCAAFAALKRRKKAVWLSYL